MSDAEENTFRALKGEDLIITSKWCWWGFHKWTKWNNDRKFKDWKESFIIQSKYCVHCNDFKERKKILKA